MGIHADELNHFHRYELFEMCFNRSGEFSCELLICLREIMEARLGRDIKQVCGEGRDVEF